MVKMSKMINLPHFTASKDEQNDQLTPLSDTKIAPISRKGL